MTVWDQFHDEAVHRVSLNQELFPQKTTEKKRKKKSNYKIKSLDKTK